MNDSRVIFALIYIPLMIVLGETIHAQGRKLLRHAFGSDSPVASAVSMLLRLGWYITSGGLLLWNLGVDSGTASNTVDGRWTDVSLRLGVALFVVGVLHGLNILAVSLFHRKNAA